MDPLATSPDARGLLIAAVVAQFVTFAGVLTAAVFAYLRDGRTRKWLLEDRAHLAVTTTAAADAQTSHTTTATNGLHASLVVIQQDLAETKKAAADAYSEANHVNLKLERIGLDQLHVDESRVAMSIKLAVRKELARLRKQLRGTATTEKRRA